MPMGTLTPGRCGKVALHIEKYGSKGGSTQEPIPSSPRRCHVAITRSTPNARGLLLNGKAGTRYVWHMTDIPGANKPAQYLETQGQGVVEVLHRVQPLELRALAKQFTNISGIDYLSFAQHTCRSETDCDTNSRGSELRSLDGTHHSRWVIQEKIRMLFALLTNTPGSCLNVDYGPFPTYRCNIKT